MQLCDSCVFHKKGACVGDVGLAVYSCQSCSALLSVTSPFSSSQEPLSNELCYWEKGESWLPIDPQDLSGSSCCIYIKLPFYSPLATSVLFLLELACQNNRVLNSTKTRDFLLSKPGEEVLGKLIMKEMEEEEGCYLNWK